jgi:hypothetical protein
VTTAEDSSKVVASKGATTALLTFAFKPTRVGLNANFFWHFLQYRIVKESRHNVKEQKTQQEMICSHGKRSRQQTNITMGELMEVYRAMSDNYLNLYEFSKNISLKFKQEKNKPYLYDRW